MKKSGKIIGSLFALVFMVSALFVIMEYLRNWRHSINVIIDSVKGGWE